MQLFDVMKNDATFFVVFLISPKTVGIQILIYHSTLTVRSYKEMVVSAVQIKKQAIIFLKVFRERTTLV